MDTCFICVPLKIGVVFILIIVALQHAVLFIHSHAHTVTTGVAFTIVYIVVALLYLLGAHRERPGLMFPLVVYYPPDILVIVTINAVAFARQEGILSELPGTLKILFDSFYIIVALLLLFYFFTVLYSYYIHIKQIPHEV